MKYAEMYKSSEQAEGQFIHHEEQETKRLNKYISDSGFSSRRAADRLIEEGRVTVDGVSAVLGVRVEKGQKVTVDGVEIKPEINRVYIVLNKPTGIVSTTDTLIEGNITTFMNYPEMIFPIGRLDKDSDGLLLLTNDGDIVNKILREEYGHDKEYLVKVDKPMDSTFLKEMSAGVTIYNAVSNKYQKTNPCKIIPQGSRSFMLTLNQGLNRQIRRMTNALGYRTTGITRQRVMNIVLGDLPVGQWRYLTKEELIEIDRAIE